MAKKGTKGASGTKRTAAQLKATAHGKVLMLARVAYAIGNRQAPIKTEKRKKGDKVYEARVGSFSGVPALADTKYPNGAFYGAAKEGSAFFRMATDSAEFKALYAKAKAAHSDLVKQTWSPAVKGFLQAFMETRGTGPRGERGISTKDIADLSL